MEVIEYNTTELAPTRKNSHQLSPLLCLFVPFRPTPPLLLAPLLTTNSLSHTIAHSIVTISHSMQYCVTILFDCLSLYIFDTHILF